MAEPSGRVRMMVALSYSGFDCVLFLIVVVAFLVVARNGAVLAGLGPTGIVREITRCGGWVRHAAFLCSVTESPEPRGRSANGFVDPDRSGVWSDR